MPRLEDFIGAQAPGGRRAQPGDFGSGAGLAQLGRAVGEIGDVLEQFVQTEIAQRSAAEAAEVRAELNTLLADPLLTLDQFEKDSKEIVNRHQATLPFPKTKADFSLKVGGLVERGRAQVRGAQMKRLADEATDHLDRLQQRLADQFGLATSPEVKKEILDEFVHALNIAQQQRVIGHVDRFKREQVFTREVQGGDIREAIRRAKAGPATGAADAVTGLLDGTLGRGLSEADRQSYISTAVRGWEADLRRRNAEANRLDQAQIRALKKTHDAAVTELDNMIDKVDRGDTALLGDFNIRFEELFDVLSQDERKFYRRRQRDGGGLIGGESNPLTYNTLDALATAGQAQTIEGVNVKEAIEIAYRNDLLDRPDRDRLLAKSEDRRFGDAEEFMKDSLDASGMQLGRKRFVQQAKTALALRDFTDFRIANPNATRQEAFDFAEDLVVSAGTFDLRKIAIANIKPLYSIFVDPAKPIEIDIIATRRATRAAWESKELDDRAYQVQLERIVRMEKAQNLARSRRKK